jgi:protein disulfide-isomerase A5
MASDGNSAPAFDSANVRELTKKDFYRRPDGKIYPKQDNTIVLFYAPWCYWCNKLKPEWAAFADDNAGASGGFSVAAANCDEHPEIATALGIDGFPTIMLFTGREIREYGGERSKAELASFVRGAEAGAGSAKAASAPAPQQPGPSGAGGSGFFEGGSVVELAPANFDLKRRQFAGVAAPLVVLYYAPWCYWCNQVKPEWVRLSAKAARMGAAVAALDCAKHPVVGDAMHVEGYPTIKLYTGASFESEVVYHGERTAEKVFDFVAGKLREAAAARGGAAAEGPAAGAPPTGGREAAARNKAAVAAAVPGRPVFVALYSRSNYDSMRVREEVLPRVAHKFQRYVKVGALDCDEHRAMCAKLQVAAVPAFLLIKGTEVLKYTGPATLDDLSNFLVALTQNGGKPAAQ